MADADPFLPPARPIRAVSDLDHWQPGQDPFNVASVPLRARPGDAQHAGRRREGVGKVLVCHDMAGGYKADALPQGYLGYDATTQYSLQYWMLVDQFIYFSHERFSVPPSCWTNAAHRHGVKVYATFIAEWEQGILETLKLIYGPTYNPPPPPPPGSEIRPPLSPFPTAPISDFYIHKMVGLALYYGFDGWFLNVESDLACTTHADALRKFVESLTQAMHKAIPGSLVQWYDSVTITGRLRWQDHLNVRNAPFFRSCDSIFVNYTWKEDFPLKSAQLAASIESNGSSKIGQNPRDRTLDVFTGIDVWGRNTFGGGGFNVHKALRKISTSSTSVAIFAPGWTYETFPHEQFGQIDRRFWFGVPRLLKPTFPPRNPNEPPPTTVEDENDLGSVASYVEERLSGTDSFFYTNFDRGFGNAYYIRGLPIRSAPWFNLSGQNPQPSRRSLGPSFFCRFDEVCDDGQPPSFDILAKIEDEPYETHSSAAPLLTTDYASDAAWHGGTSLELLAHPVEGSLPLNAVACLPLFHVNIPAGCCGIFARAISSKSSPPQRAAVYAKLEMCSDQAIGSRSSKIIVKVFSPTENWSLCEIPLKSDICGVDGDWHITEVGIGALASSLGALGASTNAALSVARFGEIGIVSDTGHGISLSRREVNFSFAVHDTWNDGTHFTLDWGHWQDPIGSADRWEVSIDGLHAGTAFVTRFRVQGGAASENHDVTVEGFGCAGQSIVVLCGTTNHFGMKH